MAHNPECGLDCVSAGAVRKTSALGKNSPRDLRRDTTTYVRDIKTGDVICAFNGRHHAFDEVQHAVGGTVFAWTSIQHGDLEGTEYITADGEPVAWIDEGPGERYLTDEIHEVLFPMRQAAE
jgi:hypothetical protein